MASRSTTRRRSFWKVALATLLVLPGLVGTTAAAQPDSDVAGSDGAAEIPAGGDVDARPGQVAPTAAQRSAAEALGATRVSWNEFGTPRSMINHEGYLAGPRQGSPVEVARAFVDDNRGLFRLSAAQVDDLEVLQDAPRYSSPDYKRLSQGREPRDADVAHAVKFRQTFGDLVPYRDGLLTVSVDDQGRVSYVSSSVTGDSQVSGSEQLSPTEAIRAAADDRGLKLGDLTKVEGRNPDFMTFTSSVSPDVQRVRRTALPTPENGVRRAYEVTLLDNRVTLDNGEQGPKAYISFVDAETGKVWVTANQVHTLGEGFRSPALATLQQPSGGGFTGTVPPGPAGTCGQDHIFAVSEGNGQITASATGTNPPASDLTMKLIYVPTGEVVATQDTLFSPEALAYAPSGGVPAGEYNVKACRFNSGENSLAYAGHFEVGPAPDPLPFPQWRVFEGNPPIGFEGDQLAYPSEDTRRLECWDITAGTEEACDYAAVDSAPRVLPWDEHREGPTFTTDGNNASTAIANASFLSPDTAFQRPIAPNRSYDFAWNNTWFESKCDPSVFGQPGGNDDFASVTNLFVGHNRMHDWSYFLGLTETTSAAQYDNFGATDSSRENDPEVGDAQAGRLTINGRDNANQITLQDGVPPITNQYLWQPLAALFYPPCADGAYDFSVYGHEYTHLISNRMTGGPSGSLSGFQADAMGEGWSDFAAIEVQREFDALPGDLAYALGAYVTGDDEAGIRNYGFDDYPHLHYGAIGYDITGPEFHADGEIWNAVNFALRQRLVEAYDDQFPVDDRELQVLCARGERAAASCPGNRRWIQLIFDGFLIQPGDATMLDARDAMLAADKDRFDGANQQLLWDAFAEYGMGAAASSDGSEDTSPVADFTSFVTDDEATVAFEPADVGGGIPESMEVFVGVYEARTRPAADTNDQTDLDNELSLVPGTYEFIARADGYGAYRFRLQLKPGADATVELPLRPNLASTHAGATASGDGVNLESLIDDTEETNWASLDPAPSPDVEGAFVQGRQVTVELGDQPRPVTDVQVSALLRPDIGDQQDPDGQNRFTALRSFNIEACNAAEVDCSSDEGFTEIFASADDAFPGIRPRPRAPEMTLRPFDVTDTQATHLRLVVRDSQCTGGPDYQGEANPDNDPQNTPDCDTGSHVQLDALGPTAPGSPPEDRDLVRAAELQAFGQPATTPAIEGDGVNVASAVDTEAICPPDQVPESGFGDIADSVHRANIECIKWYTITEGVTASSYAPDQPVNRGQMASFIARLATEGGVEVPAEASDAFDDDDGTTHEANINALAELGLVDGVGGGDFAPGAPVSRAQMATFIANVHEAITGRLPTDAGDAFDDDNGGTHEASINALAALGVVQGRADTGDADGDGNTDEFVYAASDNVSRGQMASFIITDLTLLVEAGDAFAGGADVTLDERTTTPGGEITGTVTSRKQLVSLTAGGCGLDGQNVEVADDGAFSVTIGADVTVGSCTLDLTTVTQRSDQTQQATEAAQITVRAAS